MVRKFRRYSRRHVRMRPYARKAEARARRDAKSNGMLNQEGLPLYIYTSKEGEGA